MYCFFSVCDSPYFNQLRFFPPFPSLSPLRHWMNEKTRRMTREAMPIPLNVTAAPAKQRDVRRRKTSLCEHDPTVTSYQSSWRTLLPPWLHSRGPSRGAGPAGCPAPTSSGPAGPPHSGRRYKLPKLRRGSHLWEIKIKKLCQNRRFQAFIQLSSDKCISKSEFSDMS